MIGRILPLLAPLIIAVEVRFDGPVTVELPASPPSSSELELGDSISLYSEGKGEEEKGPLQLNYFDDAGADISYCNSHKVFMYRPMGLRR
jgi:hypothetical protein